MSASHERAQRGADHSTVSLVSISAPPGANAVVVGHNGGVVTAEDIDWHVAHLQTMAAASPVV